MAGSGTAGSATSSRGISSAGIRLRLGALSSGPRWPCSRTGKCAKIDHWLGLRRRGRELQWGDGSSFNSSVPVLGNGGCLFLAEDNYLRSAPCSNPLLYVCSRPQTRL
ncbi:C-type lectin domain family 2 member B-like [Malurus melanocephalus]|uniref:C-type lectin domain family 2 member B-like n=1 Tax=Malurus melanocephalus TaxID=175006 RepID=UPI00254795E1|nr:C-type lectin domain family 2 member B-like [Malurus melanocephalus]